MDIMSELVGSHQVVKLDGRLLIKGFCSLLVATAAVPDVVVWHFLHNSDGRRISYSDEQLNAYAYQTSPDLSLRDLEGRRHIVGWCSQVDELCGEYPSYMPWLRFLLVASKLTNTIM